MRELTSVRWCFLVALMAAALVAFAGGCSRRANGDPGAKADPSASFVVKDSSEGLLLTWIDEKGDFHVEQKVSDVPLVGRDAVRVLDPNRDEGTHADMILVADLRTAHADGAYPVKSMTRSEFDKLALDRRQKKGLTLAAAPPSSTAPEAPAGAQRSAQNAPDPDLAARPAVIIYGASWCSACHEAAAYLRRKNVRFVEKDVEADSGAAREMHAKLAKAGLRGGSIPVLDVRGTVMVGFNPRSVDDALGKAL